jgi:hypothetical protein
VIYWLSRAVLALRRFFDAGWHACINPNAKCPACGKFKGQIQFVHPGVDALVQSVHRNVGRAVRGGPERVGAGNRDAQSAQTASDSRVAS